MPTRRLFPVLFAFGVTSCAPAPGLNGPKYAEPESASGPCFEVNLMDGIEDGDELLVVFSCFNQYGAFDELEPLITYLATSDKVTDVVDASNELLGDFDLASGMEIAVNLLTDEDAPLSRAAGLYTEAVDEDLLRPTLGVAREAAAELARCEETDDPVLCDPIRLVLPLLDTDVPDQAANVLSAISDKVSEDDRSAMLKSTATLLYQTSTVYERHDGNKNSLLALGSYFLSDNPVLDDADADAGLCGTPLDALVDDPTPLAHLLPYIQYLLSDDLDGDGAADADPLDDDLLAQLALPIGQLYANGILAALPDELSYLFTHDSDGNDVGWTGTNVLDELMAVTAALGADPTLLCQEFELPGDDAPTTALELALDTLDDLYVRHADVTEIVDAVSETVDLLCDESDTTVLCALAGQMLPPVQAIADNAPSLFEAVLPIAYALHRTADVSKLLPLMNLAIDLDLMNQTRDITVISLQNDSISKLLPMIPVFISPELGRYTPAGTDAVALVRFALSDWSPDGSRRTVVPLEVPLDVARAVLSPTYPNADLDFLLGTMGALLLDENSGFYPDNLTDLLDQFTAAMGDQQVDVEATVRKVLENETLWLAGLRLGSSATLMDLLTPIEGRPGASWYLYDTIQSGLLDRILNYAVDLLASLQGKDLGDERTRHPTVPTADAELKGGR